MVVQPLDISGHMGLWGSDGGSSPGNRFIQLFVVSDGKIVFNRKLNTWDIQSAPGVIVEGEKYVITARSSGTQGMMIRVNGVQVAVDLGLTAGQITFDNLPTRIGVIDDQISGGIGRVFGEKRIVWNSFHSIAVTDAEIAQMERFLGDKFGIEIATTGGTSQPAIASQVAEYDIDSYDGEIEGSQVGPWTDDSGNANNTTIDTGSPEYEAGAWSPGIADVLFTSSGQIQFDGSAFAGADYTLFIVFRTFDLSSSEPLTGGSSFTDRFMLETFVGDDGRVTFSHGTNEGDLAVTSAPGEILADGTCYVLTLQFTAAGGKIIRKAQAGAPGSFGTEIASNPASTATLSFWFGSRLADINGVVPSNQMKLAWFSGNLVAASVAEMQQMETFLLETFCEQEAVPPSLWFPEGPAEFDFSPPVAGVKPDIANPEIEYDARTLDLILSDGDPVVTWADQSGNANDAIDAPAPGEQPTFRADRWAPGSGIPSVEFLNFGIGPPSREEEMRYTDSTVWFGQEITLFIVARIIDLSEGGAFIGSAFGGTPPREMDVSVFPTGEIFWGFGTETIPTAVVTNIITAPGTVVAGEKLLITVRSTNGASGFNPEGMLIRLNGQQVASVPSFVTPQVSWGPGAIGRSQNTGSPELGLPGGTIWGKDRLIAWIGGYSGAASNTEIFEMESFLHDTFGFDFLRKWTPRGTQVPVATAWTQSGAVGGSGVPFLKNGVQVGWTDFGEFAVAPGVPAGITEYGITPNSPTDIDIALDPVEGNFFAAFPHGFSGWGFGLDAFDGLMDLAGGELLARVFLDIPVNGRKLMGPAANMEGLIGAGEPGADFDNWSGGLFRLDPDELSGLFTTSNGSSSNSVTANTQEAWQDNSWMWVRASRVQNAINPLTEDDFFITAWFGDLADEPASVDGSNIGQARSGTWVAGAIGCAMPGNAGASTPQGIAFLSFSADPLLAAPPLPGEVPISDTLWTPNP
jgi:hypothetical protein